MQNINSLVKQLNQIPNVSADFNSNRQLIGISIDPNNRDAECFKMTIWLLPNDTSYLDFSGGMHDDDPVLATKGEMPSLIDVLTVVKQFM